MLAVVALAAPRLAHADFEGVLDAKITGRTTGTVRTWISKDAMRSEVELQPPPNAPAAYAHPIRSVSIIRTSEPGKTYFLDEKSKSYHVAESEGADHGSDDEYVVKKLGRDTVAGLPCEKVSISTKEGGRESEACVATELLGSEFWYRAFQAREGGKPGGLHKALLDAGLKGLPIRWEQKGKNGEDRFKMELVSAKQQRVPASTFEIPAGYTKKESAMSAMTPEGKAQLEEAMKNMTPEQKKRMEELMKRMKGGEK
jgi:hypothetical protein